MNKDKLIKILKNSIAVIVLVSLFIIIFYQNRDRDIFKFGKNESNSVTSATTDSSMGYLGADIRKVGEEVCYITTTSLNLFDEDSNTTSVEIALSDPVLHTEDDYIVCYNKDSKEAEVYKKSNLIYAVQTDNNIITAKVNKNGYLFIATEKEGYNCECRVYNRSGEAIFKWDISKGEFIDGDLNCSNSAIALSVANSGNDKLIGEVILIDVTDANVISRETFESRIFYTIDFNHNDTFNALANDSVAYFNADGTQKWSQSFEGKTLLKADVSNPDIITIALSDPGIGIGANQTDIKVINRLGAVVAEKSYDDAIVDITTSKSAIALAFGRKIIITDSLLKEKKSVESEVSINKVELYNDNKHLFVLSGTGGEILK